MLLVTTNLKTFLKVTQLTTLIFYDRVAIEASEYNNVLILTIFTLFLMQHVTCLFRFEYYPIFFYVSGTLLHVNNIYLIIRNFLNNNLSELATLKKYVDTSKPDFNPTNNSIKF